MRQNDDVISSRRALLRTRRHWYPIMVDLHKFMVGNVVNHDGNGATRPSSSFRVIIDHASRLVFGTALLALSLIMHEDVAVWPCGGNILLDFATLLASLEQSATVIRPHLQARRSLVGTATSSAVVMKLDEDATLSMG